MRDGAAIEIATPRGAVTGVLHEGGTAFGAMVMVGGAGGGLQGPAGVYAPLAGRLAAEGAAAARIEYRYPNHLAECVYDTLAAVEWLSRRGVSRVVLLGWSFGGAVVISAGALSDRVVGVATVASQTAGTDLVARLAPRSLLLIHGTGDTVLSDRCSRDIYRRAGEPKEMILYPDDDHAIREHAPQMLEALFSWSRDLLWPARGG